MMGPASPDRVEAGDEARPILLRVSPALFQLLTECIRLRSNAMRRLESVDTLLVDLLHVPSGDLDLGAIEDHLAALEAAGPILVEFRVTASDERAFVVAQTRLSRHVGRPLGVLETVSVLLFTYVTAQAAERVLAALGRQPIAPGDGPTPTGPNILPFRT